MFYVGLHQPSDAKHFERCCISINRLRNRKSVVPTGGIVMIDSGAFTELKEYGRYRHSVSEYATALRHVCNIAPVEFAVSQDYMCEPFMLGRTGLTVSEHQRLTIDRYDALLGETLSVPILPVLQGYSPYEYRNHLRAYGSRLQIGMRVGVGSVCKRNASPTQIVDVLSSIKFVRPDLRLHGFGIKVTSLTNLDVREMLYSSDSMAWSHAARMEGRNANSWLEAQAFEERINNILKEQT